MSSIDIKAINELARRRNHGSASYGTSTRRANDVPRGTYTGTVVGITTIPDPDGKDFLRAQIEVADGPQAGKAVSVRVREHTPLARMLGKAASSGMLLAFDVFRKQYDDGRQVSLINRETLKPAGEALSPPGARSVEIVRTAAGRISNSSANMADGMRQAACSGRDDEDQPHLRQPNLQEILSKTEAYGVGFDCVGPKSSQRRFIDWHVFLRSFSVTGESVQQHQPAFQSKYCFTSDIVAFAENNPAKPGSVSGYSGSAYGPFIDFDIDYRNPSGRPSPEDALPLAISLAETLRSFAIPSDLIRVYFSGAKGFHICVPSSLAGALPSAEFPAIEKRFCREIAKRSDVEIDEGLYQTVHLLRVPNTRHETSGLYKIPVTFEELKTLAIGDILQLAAEPRPVPAPSLAHEPVPAVAELWRRAAVCVDAPRAQPGRTNATGSPSIFQSTWNFLVNGAADGERATELFKAAANLNDFDSREDLIRALLSRGVEISGLPASEAEGHINGALGCRNAQSRSAPF